MTHWTIDLILLLLGIPVAVFLTECLLGLLPPPGRRLLALPEDLRTAILIPAHNEAAVIAATLKDIRQQVGEHDQVVVVADNCGDDTDRIARELGCTVIERHSEQERGKGYALAYGVEHLKQQDRQPNIVVIIDADCRLGERALTRLKQEVISSGRPVQACYLMRRGDVERIAVKVAEFAFLVKNKIRLRGLARLGLPVPLTGTGMAFPWRAICDAELATGDIVEDMRLGVELAEQGVGAAFSDEAQVFSFFPSSEAAAKTQRERWEHGHLNTLRHYAPRLFKRALGQPSWQALGMMLDLIVPPLSLLVMMIGAVWVLSLGWGVLGGYWGYADVASAYLLGLLFSIVIAWLLHGRSILSAREMLHIPVYVVAKLAIYLGYIVRKQTKWIRTDRS